MARALSLLVAAAALLSVTESITVKPKVLHMGYMKEKRAPSDQLPPRLARRQKSVQASLVNSQYLYYINITIGTPGQPIALQLDTGSSDLWIPSAQSNICKTSPGGCDDVGSYNPSQSSSFTDRSRNTFNISYVDGSTVAGDYITDVVRIGSTQITNMTMGLATKGQEQTPLQGIMGVGYQIGESIVHRDPSGIYPNIINQLKAQGHINSLAYSLYLDDLTESAGNILFGGVDTNKYHGQLSLLDILPFRSPEGDKVYTTFAVAFTGLAVDNGAPSPTQLDLGAPALVAILDSGTSLTLLPDDVVDSIYRSLGVQESQKLGGYVIPCTAANRKATFMFSFGGKGGPTINVDLNEFVLPLTDDKGKFVNLPRNGGRACQIGIVAAGNDPILLGDTFLRSAYVVYDLEHNQIGIANTNFRSKDTNIKEIRSNGTIPDGVRNTASFALTKTATDVVGRPTAGAGRNTASVSGDVSASTVTAGRQEFTLGPTTGTAAVAVGAGATSNAAGGARRAPSVEMSAVLAGGVIVLACMLGGAGLMLVI